MTGIDTAIASLLANSIDSLLTNGVGSFSNTTTAQTGASSVAVDTTNAAAGLAGLLPDAQASAQTVLSEVALTLDAISRFGGEATPAVVGETPIWPAPPAINVAAGTSAELFPAFDSAAAAGGDAAASASAASQTQGAALSASTVPVGLLASALAQAVSDSGLFYESHLAQWLTGLRMVDSLAAEPQTRLAAGEVQLPLAWGGSPSAADADDATLSSWLDGQFSSLFGGGDDAQAPASAAAARSAQNMANASPAAANNAAMPGYAAASRAPMTFATSPFGASTFGAYPTGGTQAAQPASSPFAQQSSNSASQANSAAQSAPASIAASIHPATIPLVRQQLDLLATDQFRWTGEVWPGAKLDWTIEPDGGQHANRQGADPSDYEQPWRTRLTLALPTLGTVDAELTLTGTRLVARVQASPGGAARLSAEGDAFRRRLQAAGIELSGLSIREIGGTSPATGPSAASAAFAYARSAAASVDADDVVDAEVIDKSAATTSAAGSFKAPDAPAKPASTSPLDRLFQDPFEWGGS
ncbi:flagellar hook-length control protein FliK [Trinickia violacea]|uniref:Flagellar hook-length control protein FliK n=1 Tax=Trinickia violacea TaxID=2571746 RepID=A0A4V1EGS8_9BURK|nr:flagellar hook-length control protein FliK [Trinickia violacea]QCP47820.1 flagellar hook-length control protein FliK [Trinickia violacea]